MYIVQTSNRRRNSSSPGGPSTMTSPWSIVLLEPRQSPLRREAAALGFVGVRVLEASTIFLCVVSLLSVVTLRQAGVGADGLLASQALVAFHDWIFLLGQGFLPAVNALLLGSLLYQSRLVPRVLRKQ